MTWDPHDPHHHHHHHRHGHQDTFWSDLVKWFLRLFDRAVASSSADMKNAPPESEDAAERAQRVGQLRAQGDDAAIAELETLAQDPSRTVRMMAQDALAQLRAARDES